MSSILSTTSVRTLLLGNTLAGAMAGCSVGEQKQDVVKYPATNAGTAAPEPSLRQQTKAVRTYAKTTFKLAGLDEAQLAGLDLKTRGGAALTPAQLEQLSSATRGSADVPLRLRLRLEARNPNREKVMLNQLEYLVMVDNREVARGTTDDVLEVGGRKTLSIPLTVTANVRNVLAIGLKPENLASAFATWNQQPARVRVRVRPTFQNVTGRAFRTTDFEPIPALLSVK